MKKTFFLSTFLLILVILLGHQSDLNSQSVDQPSLDNFEHKAFADAARRRYDVKIPASITPASPADAEDIRNIVATEILIQQLIGEARVNNPELIAEVEGEVMERQPKIYVLTPLTKKGSFQKQAILVTDTRRCSEKLNTPEHTAKVSALFSDFCVDELLEFPGGFDRNEIIQISVHEVSERNSIEQAGQQWDLWMGVMLRKAIKHDFLMAGTK